MLRQTCGNIWMNSIVERGSPSSFARLVCVWQLVDTTSEVNTRVADSNTAASLASTLLVCCPVASGGICLAHIFLDKLLRSSFLQEDIPTIWQNSTKTQGFLNTFYLKFGHFPVIPGRSIFYLIWKPSHSQFRVGFLFEQLPLYLQEFHDRGQCLITNQASFVKYPLVEQFATGWGPQDS